MATGIEFLLKSLGIDPQKIAAEFGQQLQQFTNGIESVVKRLDAIERQQREILEALGKQPYVAEDDQVDTPQLQLINGTGG